MSYVKIWIHAVWTVKNRKPLLESDIRRELFSHIHENALAKGILIEVVSGHHNHVHCLFRLKNDQSIDKVMQLLKGESSFWLNKSGLIKTKIGWQKEYFAVSVGEFQVDAVRKYIENQEEHHKRKSWEEEYNEFITKYGFKIING
jgi:putative transposase